MTFGELMQECLKIKNHCEELGFSNFELGNLEIIELLPTGKTKFSDFIELNVAEDNSKYFIIKGKLKKQKNNG